MKRKEEKKRCKNCIASLNLVDDDGIHNQYHNDDKHINSNKHNNKIVQLVIIVLCSATATSTS